MGRLTEPSSLAWSSASVAGSLPARPVGRNGLYESETCPVAEANRRAYLGQFGVMSIPPAVVTYCTNPSARQWH
jgi:hypothetical protein